MTRTASLEKRVFVHVRDVMSPGFNVMTNTVGMLPRCGLFIVKLVKAIISSFALSAF